MNRKQRLKLILIVIAAAVCITAVLLIASRLEERLAKEPAGADTSPTVSTVRRDEEASADGAVSPLNDDSEPVMLIQYGDRAYRFNTDLDVLLLMGIDDYGLTEYENYQNDSQADFLLLAVFDPSDKAVTLLHINRDTMMDVPLPDGNGGIYGYTFEQITLAHSYGSGLEDSCENTALAVSELLYGIPIDNYFAVTMDTIPIVNDLAGGVTVTVEDSFEGIDDTLIQGQTVTLMGDQAESFVRARRGMPEDASNIARMRRQRTYMTALIAAMKRASAENDGFAFDLFSAINDYLVTDCTAGELYDYINRLSDYSLGEIISPEGEIVQGEIYKEFYVDEEALQALVVELFFVPAE